MDINTNGAGSAAGSTEVMCSASNKNVEARSRLVGQSEVVVISRREYERLEKLEERVKNLEKELKGRDARISKVESGVCEAKRGVDEAKRGVDETKKELRRTQCGIRNGFYK